MFVEEINTKKSNAILFLHGVGFSHHMWDRHLKKFDDYHCIAPDLPGHGKSNKERWTTLEEVSEKIFGIIKKSGHKKINLVGLSLGGSIIYQLLRTHPEYIESAIIDGAGVVPLKNRGLIKLGVKITSRLLKQKFVLNLMSKTMGISSELDRTNFENDMRAVDPESFYTAFAQANEQTLPMFMKNDIPVLFVCGDREPKEIHESNRIMVSSLKDSIACCVPGSSHGWLASKPELHVSMVHQWIENRKLVKGLNPEK